MSRLWVLTVLGLIAVLAIACGDSGDDLPQSVSSPTLTASVPATPSASASPTATAIRSPTVTPTSAIPVDWPTFASPDGQFTIRYPSDWFLEEVPIPPPSDSPAYSVGSISNFRPGTVGQNFPISGVKLDLEVSIPSVGNDCRVAPAGGTASKLGDSDAWERQSSATTGDSVARSVFISAFRNGRCYTVAAYFGSGTPDDDKFREIVNSFVFVTARQ